MPNKVFISYSHQQSDWVLDRLVPCLNAGGADVAIDRNRFAAGKTVIGQMDAELDAVDICVLVLSPDYLESDYCLHEMERAVARDPSFEHGVVIPVMRKDCEPPSVFEGPNEPLRVDLRDDRQATQWELLLAACDADLGTAATRWLEARDEVRRFLGRGQSVNLVVDGRRIAWSPLIRQLGDELDLRYVDLENPATITRRGLVGELLRSAGAAGQVPAEPEDLAELGRVIAERYATRVALAHFDLVKHRDYGLDLFTTLRYLQMQLKKLVLVVQSHKPFATLLPADHPLSEIDLKTVELRGSP